MNNCSFNSISNKTLHYFFKLYVFKSFLILSGTFIMIGPGVTSARAQKVRWQYVTTSTVGGKTYLNVERKALPGKNQGAWEKMIDADGSSVVSLVEWDCAAKSRLMRQITYFNSQQIAIGAKTTGFTRSAVIPGSAGDFLYRRICLPSVPRKWARVIDDGTALLAAPDYAASVARRALEGERFLIVPETGLGGLYNVVDPETQQDFWLHKDGFEMIEDELPLKNRKATTGASPNKTAPAVIKRKPQKTIGRKTRS